ncbi:g-patch domain protein [Onchocerca flexuosa]|uniref:G-patch domain protein n=1 Tax=Onchocerca flexuosa TaxID=387005 RepID=A0A238BP32_9BILA|nr:g-patch domain protein [Onchocerca flexuosa]
MFLTTSRQEQRNAINSQNIAWKNDDSKFGKVMLEKMGWKSGRGLGKHEQGITENLQMKANILTRGLGCSERNDNVWLAHHDDFAAILADLNKKKEKSEAREIKKSLRKVKSKIILNEHRKDRYLPDLSVMSEKDKCAIFGKRLTPRTVSKSTEENMQQNEIKSESSFGNMIVKSVSINDYFAQKMLDLNKRRKV